MFLFQLPGAIWSFEYLPVLFCIIKEPSFVEEFSPEAFLIRVFLGRIDCVGSACVLAGGTAQV